MIRNASADFVNLGRFLLDSDKSGVVASYAWNIFVKSFNRNIDYVVCWLGI
jgi:hypothetical protein